MECFLISIKNTLILRQGVENKQANDHPLLPKSSPVKNPLGFDDMKQNLSIGWCKFLVWCFRDPIFQRIHVNLRFYRNTIAKIQLDHGSVIFIFWILSQKEYLKSSLRGKFYREYLPGTQLTFFLLELGPSKMERLKPERLKLQLSFSSTIGVEFPVCPRVLRCLLVLFSRGWN